MKRLLILIFIGLQFFTFAQTDTLNRTDKFGKKYGYWKKYNKQNKLDYEGTFFNGEPVGKFIYYHDNGKIKNISYYTPNSPVVNTTMFHENGKKLAEGDFYNREKDGKWLIYSSTGKLVAEENFVKGKKNGVSKIYSPQDETLLEEVNWLDDKKNGVSINYFTTGKIRMKMFYNLDKMHGSFENYYENGKIKTKGQYAKNFREGKWVSYDEKGRELKIEYFKRGRTNLLLLGFRTEKEWKLINVNKIAYFYQKNPRIVIVQLHDSTQIAVADDLLRIATCTTQEYFIFLNETVLSSYEAIKKLIPSKINSNQAKVILSIQPPFDVITHDNYYDLLKTIVHPKRPKLE